MNRYAITTNGIYNHQLGEWVKASDVDALLADVRALVEAAKAIDLAIDIFNNARVDMSLAKKVAAFNVLFNASDRLTKAIAAVERLEG